MLCFLVRHDIREEPRKKHKPVMDLLVSTHPAQSASVKPKSCMCDDLEKNKPLPGEFFKYLITLHAAL